MKIVEYFTDNRKEHWKTRIAKADWGAADFLLKRLNDNNMLSECIGEDAKLFLLTDEDRLAAFCTLSRKDCIIDESRFPWIGFVYTFPEYRGNRCSEKLISYAEKQAAENGNSKVYICTDHIGLYEKFGYTYWESRIDCWGELSRIYYKDLLCGGKE